MSTARRTHLSQMLSALPTVRDLLLRMPGSRPVLYIPITEQDIEDVRGQFDPNEAVEEDVLRMAFDHALIDEGLAPYARPLFPIERTMFETETEGLNCVVVDYDASSEMITRVLLEQLPEGFDHQRRQVLVVPPSPDSRYMM